MRSYTRHASLFALILSCAASISAQQSGPPAQSVGNKIYLDVVVSPKSGAPVADLQQQDFTLLDDKKPQPITSFHVFTGRDAPIQVILVIDGVNTDYSHMSYERTQIDKFLRADQGHLEFPIALVLFSDKGLQIAANFSTDGNSLSDSLDKTDAGLRDIGRAAGYWGDAERLQMSVQALRELIVSEAAIPRRKLMIWVSPGWPLLSGINTQLDSKQQQGLFSEIVGISTALIRDRITIYNVDPLGAAESVGRTYYENFVKGVTKPSQVYEGDLALQVLAVQSGGIPYGFANDTAELLKNCLTDSVPYYEITFDPAVADKPNEYHQLQVKIDKPHLTARTLQGYYAQPAAH